MISDIKDYINELNSALWSLETFSLQMAADEIKACAQNHRTIFVCGNGGSAAIANHLTCDCLKGIRTNTQLKPNVVSLSSNVPLITAIANDINYESIFSYQLESMMRPGDILITISSSGNSPNIVAAIDYAKSQGNKVISMCGFDGGASLKADIPIHVKAHNYGVVEDAHQAIMHMIAQHLRRENLDPDVDITTLKF